MVKSLQKRGFDMTCEYICQHKIDMIRSDYH